MQSLNPDEGVWEYGSLLKPLGNAREHRWNRGIFESMLSQAAIIASQSSSCIFPSISNNNVTSHQEGSLNLTAHLQSQSISNKIYFQIMTSLGTQIYCGPLSGLGPDSLAVPCLQILQIFSCLVLNACILHSLPQTYKISLSVHVCNCGHVLLLSCPKGRCLKLNLFPAVLVFIFLPNIKQLASSVSGKYNPGISASDKHARVHCSNLNGMPANVNQQSIIICETLDGQSQWCRCSENLGKTSASFGKDLSMCQKIV